MSPQLPAYIGLAIADFLICGLIYICQHPKGDRKFGEWWQGNGIGIFLLILVIGYALFFWGKSPHHYWDYEPQYP